MGKRATKEKTERIFWSKVDKTPGLGPQGTCWEYTVRLDRDGYGAFTEWFFYGKETYWKAHRFAYFLTHRSIPDGLSILHSCDNPSCCNPEHLWAGTHQDNIDDMLSKGRHWKGKFSDDQISQIRSDYDALPLNETGTRKKDGGVEELAMKYKVVKSTICRIGKRQIRFI